MEQSCGEYSTGVHAPYLEAIQSVPGNTAQERHRWIADLIKERQAVCATLEEIVEYEKIPRMLVPLVQIEAAKRLIKKGADYRRSNYEAVAEALKSEDYVIVNRALCTKSFFDGSNKDITNVDYFFDHLFPQVSLCTRAKIVKCLAKRLAARQQPLAEEFFVAVDAVYGIKQALPLLVACSESFIYDKVVERNLVLPHKLLQRLYHRYPELVARYIKLSKFTGGEYERNIRNEYLYQYCDFIGKYAKKRLETFVELYELEDVPPPVTLTKKCAEAFLRYGKEHLLRKPVSYVKILPLKMIDATLMKTIFPKLFPKDLKEFHTDDMLAYLAYYPQQEKCAFLAKSYQEVYGQNLMDDTKRVTMKLMKILPIDERIRQARRKLEAAKFEECMDTRYEYSWRCYLTTEEVMPILKKEIAEKSDVVDRASIVIEMIYACQVNDDHATLLDVLKYIRDRHKNERERFFTNVMDALREIYEVHELSNDHWAVLMDILRMTFVKNSIEIGVLRKILKEAARHNLTNDLPIDNIIDTLLDLKGGWWGSCFNILVEQPDYEKKCIEKFAERLEYKLTTDPIRWKADLIHTVPLLVSAVYNFNERHAKRNAKVERMSVSDYPWLFSQMVTIIETVDPKEYEYREIKEKLFEHDAELFKRFWPEEPYASVKTGAALALLKRDPVVILKNWEKYYKVCESLYFSRSAQRFVRSTRWYNGIPILFVKRSMEELRKKAVHRTDLRFLAILLHGDTFNRLAATLLPSEQTIDHHKENADSDYLNVHTVISSLHYANPPAPLEYLEKLCEGEYLSSVANTLYVLTRKVSTPKAVALARKLAGSRVAVRKHGIRLMTRVAGRQQLFDFLLTLWKNEKNASMREILLSQAQELVKAEPNRATLALALEMTATLKIEETSHLNALFGLMNKLPNDCIYELVETLLKVIDQLAAAGLPKSKVKSLTDSLLMNINAPTCNLLPEEFSAALARRFLFNTVYARNFVLDSYLIPAGDNFDQRMSVVAEVFVSNVRSGWDVGHPERPAHYPVNYEVHELISELTCSQSRRRPSEREIDAFLRVFLSVLTPHVASLPYLQLAFAKERLGSTTPKAFGGRMSRKLPELTQIFSPLFLSVIADALKAYSFTSSRFPETNEWDCMLGVLEGLVETGSLDGTFVAVLMLPQEQPMDYRHRYVALLRKFEASEHAVVKAHVKNVNSKRGWNEAAPEM